MVNIMLFCWTFPNSAFVALRAYAFNMIITQDYNFSNRNLKHGIHTISRVFWSVKAPDY